MNQNYKKIPMHCQIDQCLTDTKNHSDMICVVICSKPHNLRQMGKCEVIISSHTSHSRSHSREISVAYPIPMGFPWDPWELPIQAHL